MKWLLNVLLPIAAGAALVLAGYCAGDDADLVTELEARNATADSARAAAEQRATAAELRATAAERRAEADAAAADSAEAYARRLQGRLAAASEAPDSADRDAYIPVPIDLPAPDSAEVIEALSGALTACSAARRSCEAAAQRWKAAHDAEAAAHDVTETELLALREWAADALRPSWWERNDQYVGLGVGLAAGIWIAKD